MLDRDKIKRKLKEIWETHHDFPTLYVQAVLSGIPNPRKVAREIAHKEKPHELRARK